MDGDQATGRSPAVDIPGTRADNGAVLEAPSLSIHIYARRMRVIRRVLTVLFALLLVVILVPATYGMLTTPGAFGPRLRGGVEAVFRLFSG